MVIQGTAETEAVFASTMDSGYRPIEIAGFDRTIDSIFAVRRRTPFEVLFVVNICPSQKTLISAEWIVSNRIPGPFTETRSPETVTE